MNAKMILEDLIEDPKNNGDYKLAIEGEELRRLWASIEQSEREIEDLKRDKERLKICDENKWCVLFNGRIYKWTVMAHDQVIGAIGKGRTMREAIDDAITLQKGQS